MTFVQEWRPGMLITSDRLNSRNKTLVIQNDTLELTPASFDNPVATEIRYEVEPNAAYRWWCGISYSAVTQAENTGTALGRWWSTPPGTNMGRFTASYVAAPPTGVNNGASVIMRRPNDTTIIPAGGSNSDLSGTLNFHSCQEQGVLFSGSERGEIVLMVQHFRSVPNVQNVILHGGNQTRAIFERIS